LIARPRVSKLVSLATFSLACWIASAAATVRVFVEPFPDKPGAAMLRDEIVKLLGKEQGIAVVTDASQSDYIVSGSGETYVRGYVGTNPRVHYLNSDAKPVYGGFLSVELKPRGQDTVWSYLATPRRLGPQDIDSNLAGQIVHKLAEIARGETKP
jgi:hypothetical protein